MNPKLCLQLETISKFGSKTNDIYIKRNIDTLAYLNHLYSTDDTADVTNYEKSGIR